jgi:hypothetical protein
VTKISPPGLAAGIMQSAAVTAMILNFI